MDQAVKWFVVVLMSVLGTSAGCGGGLGLVPVEGVVTLDGRPVADATVVFAPLRATYPGPFAGTTDAEGRFVLGPTGNEGGGVAVGEYGLIITTVKPDPDAVEGMPSPTQREIVPAAYRDGLKRIEVPKGGVKDVDFSMSTRM